MHSHPGALRTAVVAGALLAAGVLSGCGGDDEARDPTPSGSRSDSITPSGRGARVVAVVSGVASGGDVDPTPVDVSTDAGLSAFVGQFNGGDMVGKVRREVTSIDPRADLYAAVIAVGCDIPDAVLRGGPGDWEVVAAEVPDPLQECYVANTTVAIVRLPD